MKLINATTQLINGKPMTIKEYRSIKVYRNSDWDQYVVKYEDETYHTVYRKEAFDAVTLIFDYYKHTARELSGA